MMNERETVTLKPCPFCGSPAETEPDSMRPTLEESLSAPHRAKCSAPFCPIHFIVCSVDEWNTRTLPPGEVVVKEREIQTLRQIRDEAQVLTLLCSANGQICDGQRSRQAIENLRVYLDALPAGPEVNA